MTRDGCEGLLIIPIVGIVGLILTLHVFSCLELKELKLKIMVGVGDAMTVVLVCIMLLNKDSKDRSARIWTGVILTILLLTSRVTVLAAMIYQYVRMGGDPFADKTMMLLGEGVIDLLWMVAAVGFGGWACGESAPVNSIPHPQSKLINQQQIPVIVIN
jgi:hypothetical protein